MSDLHLNTARFGSQFFNGFCSEIGKNIEFLLFKRVPHINLILAISIAFCVAGAGLTNIGGFYDL